MMVDMFLPNKFVRFVVVIVAAACLISCTYKDDIPMEFPTPPPEPVATPVEPLALKPDAELEKKIEAIAAEAKGKVGVMAVVLETGESAGLNSVQRYPMQSVYKLPIAMAVMEQVKLGKLALDEKIGVTKDDMVREGMRSPLRDKDPDGGEFTIRELVRFALVESDGTASDVLIRVAGGAFEVQAFLTGVGVRDWDIANTEKEMGRDWETQYQNSGTPTAAIELLRWLDAAVKGCGCSEAEAETDPAKMMDIRLVEKLMIDSVPGEKRLKGLLPKGTVVAHKTGTGGTQNGITSATNDIGIIKMPNGNHIAIAVFVADSGADEKTREAVIAKIAKAVWDRWAKKT